MSFFQLIFKQMRQRALSTWLTVLSILLGVALAIAIMIVQRESQKLFGQSDFGYELIIGPPKGAPLQLVLNTVYHLDQSPGTLPYRLYEDMSRRTTLPVPPRNDYRSSVRLAVPFMVGDSYKGRRIVGTSPLMFGFDGKGAPLTGYDDRGALLPGYEDPDVPESDRDANKPLANSAFKYRKGSKYEFAAGRAFNNRRFEAVIGSDVAEKEHMKLGSTFQATHGMPGPNETPDIHKPVWTVVGILKPTHTANDRVLFVPCISLYAIAEHEIGLFYQTLMKGGVDPSRLTPQNFDQLVARAGIKVEDVPEDIRKKFGQAVPTSEPATAKPATAASDEQEPDAYHLDASGDIVPDLPQSQWELSAILVKTRSSFAIDQLIYNFKVINPEAVAVNPAGVMRDFFDTFLSGSTQLLLAISFLVTVVAAVAILVSIYNSISSRTREIAILRALGATRVRILSLICAEAGLIGLFGAILGFILGHAIGAVAAVYFEAKMGSRINWVAADPKEGLYLLVTVVIAIVAGLVPALKAYRTPVATNLVAS